MHDQAVFHFSSLAEDRFDRMMYSHAAYMDLLALLTMQTRTNTTISITTIRVNPTPRMIDTTEIGFSSRGAAIGSYSVIKHIHSDSFAFADTVGM